MKRSESLTLLREWAFNPTSKYGPIAANLADVSNARVHGMAAVRAMLGRDRVDPALQVDSAIRSARLAFRAALLACGIKGAL